MEHIVPFGAVLVAVAAVAWGVVVTLRSRGRRETEAAGRLGRLLFDGANDAVYLLRTDGSLLDGNDRACALYGYSRQELCSLGLVDLKPESGDEHDSISAQMARVETSGGLVLMTRQRRRDGSVFPVEISARLVANDGDKVFVAIVRDLSERSRVESELRASEDRQATILRALPIAVYTATVPSATDVSWISDSITRLTGFAPQRFSTEPGFWSSRIHPEDRDRVARAFSEIGDTGELLLTYRWQVSDGTYRSFLDNARLVRGTRGASEIMGTFLDITLQTLAEEALRESEQRYRTLIENIHDMVVEFDPDGRVVWVSPHYEYLVGYEPSEAAGRHVCENIHPDDCDAVLAELARTWARGFGQLLYRLRHKSGEWRWFESIARTYRTPSGASEGVMLARDVTQNKLAEEALRTSEAKTRAILSVMPDMVFQIDRDGAFIGASSPDSSAFLLAPTEFIGRRVEEVLPPALATTTRTSLAAALETHDLQSYDYSLVVAGTTHWYEARMVPFAADAVVAVVRDITESKVAVEALKRSELRYRQMFEMTRAVKLLIDPETATVVDANPAACEFYRYSQERLRGAGLELLECRGRSVLLPELGRLASQPGATFQTQHRLATDEQRFVEIDASPMEVAGRMYLYLIIHDVTRRQHAEAERDRGIRLLQTTAGVASHFLTTPDPRQAAAKVVETLGKAVGVDRCYWFEAFTGETGELMVRMMGEWCRPGIPAVSGLPQLQALPTSRFPRFLSALQNGDVIASMVSDFSEAEQALFALGGTRAVVVAPIVVRGTASGFLGFDLCTNPRIWQTDEIHLMHTAANAFSMALERWEQQRQRDELAGVVEQASEAVVITDTAWHILYVNPAYTSITGFPADETLGLRPRQLMLKESPDESTGEALEALERGESWSGLLVSRRRDGSVLQTQSTVFPLRDHHRAVVGFGSIHVDVTDQLKLEDQLKRSQKMEALGQFASGIAHDFNNLITVVQGTTELLLRRPGLDSALREELTTIRRTTQRSTELTSALLAFARRQVLKREDLDLSLAIGEALPMLRRVLPESITLKYTPSGRPEGVHADRGQVEQVLMNLAANARDAMPDGGTLTITTDDVTVGADYVSTHPWAKEGRYVKLSVSDTGTGMDEATIGRVFEPFFTTKEPGRGTGLGLSTVFGIVKQHGGMVDVYSVPGRGSRFSLFLPHIGRDVPFAAASPEPQTARGGTELVLVVEDQADLRKVLMSILQDLGYRVHGARDGVDALSALEEGGDSFDVVISDLVMPRMNGLELLRRCRDRFPGLAFLLQSGYSEAGTTGTFPAADRVGFIAKPYSIESLALKLRSVLDCTAETPRSLDAHPTTS